MYSAERLAWPGTVSATWTGMSSAGELGVAGEVVVSQRLLVPDVLERLDHPPDPHRIVAVVGAAGIEHQREVRAGRLAHGPAERDVVVRAAGRVDLVRLVAAPADILELRDVRLD